LRFCFLPITLLVLGLSLAQAQLQSDPATDPNAVQLPVDKQTVVVTGTWEPVPLDEADRAVTVINPERTELFRTWADLLQLDPSLDLRQRGTSTVQGDLSIRGSGFGQTLVLVNGLRFNDVQTGHHNLNLPLPLESLDRVEVLRGSGSTLYGSDAVGGAVNFITTPPSATEFRLGANVGNFGVNTQTASVAYAGEKFSQRLSGVRDFSSGFISNRDYRVLSGASETNVKTALGWTNLLVAASDRPFGAQNFYGNYNSWERTKTWFASVRQDLGERMETAVGYRRNTDHFILRRDRPSVYQNRHETEAWQAAVRRRDELKQNIALFSGVEGYRETIDSSNLGRHARNRGAAYVNFDVRALQRFSFAVGAREEVYGTGGSTRGQFSPTFAGGVWLAPGLKLRANASRAFRLPSYTDLYYADPANRGNPNLRPESAWSYEGGLQWQRGRVQADVAFFHRREHDVIDYVRYSPTDVWQATNFQRLNFTGVETSVGVQLPNRHRVQVAYAGLRGAQDSLGGTLSKYVFNYPTHNAVVSWDGLLPGNMFARTRLGVTQRYARDAYAVWDTAVSRQFGYVRARLSFANITDTAYEEIPLVAMPGRTVVAGLEFVWPKR